MPLMTTLVPTGPCVGEKEVIVGEPGGVTAKLLLLVAEPFPFVTVMAPVVADEGTVAWIWLEEFTVKSALEPLKRTLVVPMKLLPEMTTFVPVGPLVGENDVMVGEPAGVTPKSLELVAEPVPVMTEIRPVVAPGGTMAVIFVGESTV